MRQSLKVAAGLLVWQSHDVGVFCQPTPCLRAACALLSAVATQPSAKERLQDHVTTEVLCATEQVMRHRVSKQPSRQLKADLNVLDEMMAAVKACIDGSNTVSRLCGMERLHQGGTRRRTTGTPRKSATPAVGLSTTQAEADRAMAELLLEEEQDEVKANKPATIVQV